ncbi:MAG: TRAP transporter substrate-binding protein DctP [Lachnospiraceae bacterium]|nr:TRAP transporter substrate-binding protein DctP [Lachnospiraceae bacterium]
MKKKIVSLVLVAAMSLGLVACGGSAQSAAPAADAGGDQAAAPAADAAPVDDTVYEFNIDFPNPETACGYKALVEWKAKVEEESNGRLQMNIYSGGALGSLFDCVANCESGVTDGFWSGVTLYPGVFPQTEVLGLPMIGVTDHHTMNTIMNDMLANEQWMQDEWANFKVVGLHSSQPCVILSSKPVSSEDPLGSWKGQNLRLSNAYSAEWFTQLGINPVSCGINDGYENISKNVIDGGLFFLDQCQSSALYEVIDNIWLGDTVYALNMFCLNKDKYDALPDDLKAIIDNSSEFFVETIAQKFDEQEEWLMDKFAEYNVDIITVPDDQIAIMKEKTKSAWDLWVKTMNDNGYDGQAILDCALSYVAKYEK